MRNADASNLPGNSASAACSETTPLLGNNESRSRSSPVITHLRYRELFTTINMIRRTFVKNNLRLYNASADTSPRWNLLVRTCMNLLTFAIGIYRRRMITTDRGAGAMLWYSVPEDPGMPWIVTIVLKLLGKLITRRLTERQNEASAKKQNMVKDAFGDRVKDMYEIMALATAQEVQGRGYGSALVEYVLKKSDVEGRDVWVMTTDAYTFYERLGFSVARSSPVGTDTLGWDWNQNPVIIYIMHRPAKAVVESG